MNVNKEEMMKMKAWLKETGKQIREMQRAIKDYQREHGGCYPYPWGNDPKALSIGKLVALQDAYRNNHIAYSLARGKTMEQIESKHRTDENGRELNLPNMSEVNKILLSLLIKEEVIA